MPSRGSKKRASQPANNDISELAPGFHFLHVPPRSSKDANVFVSDFTVHHVWRFGTNSVSLWLCAGAVGSSFSSLLFILLARGMAFVVEYLELHFPLRGTDPSLDVLKSSLSWIGTYSAITLFAGFSLLGVLKLLKLMFAELRTGR
jgi:hypothetical protein